MAKTKKTFPVMIPIKAAERIAKRYGYHQVIVIARNVGSEGTESVVTYGVDAIHCNVAAKIGEFLKFKVMRWLEWAKEPMKDKDRVVVESEGIRYNVMVRYTNKDGKTKEVSFEEWQRADDKPATPYVMLTDG